MIVIEKIKAIKLKAEHSGIEIRKQKIKGNCIGNIIKTKVEILAIEKMP